MSARHANEPNAITFKPAHVSTDITVHVCMCVCLLCVCVGEEELSAYIHVQGNTSTLSLDPTCMLAGWLAG